MAKVLRPLIHWPRRRHHLTILSRLVSFHSTPPCTTSISPLLMFPTSSLRSAHFSSRALRSSDVTSRAVRNESSDDEDSSDDTGTVKKSRNEKKRYAKRSFRWAMELASFSPPQIKRILRVADLEPEVYEAIMVVKKLGRDVREGKRRQFSYIGRLLREAEVEYELMDGLIQATKDGDNSMFQNIPSPETRDPEDEKEEEGEKEITVENDEEEPGNIIAVARWYDGLVNKDKSITNEIYSLQDVEFDRQELRRLVRQVQSTLDDGSILEKNIKARKSLKGFLHNLVKQLPENYRFLDD